MLRRIVTLLVVVLAELVFVGVAPAGLAPASAQDKPAGATPSPAARLDSLRGTVETIDARLNRGGQSDAALAGLRGEIDPVAAQANAIAAELQPRIDAVKARLDQLGPKPDDKAPAEAPEITAERNAQQGVFNDLDATAKRARALAVQAGQVSDAVGARRRALFTSALFARSASLLSPDLWVSVVGELPADGRAAATLSTDFTIASWNRLTTVQRVVFATLVALVALLYGPAWHLVRRIRSRSETADPGRLRKAAAALRVAVATASVPLLALLALGTLAEAFDLPTQFRQIGRALSIGVALVAVMTGISRGLLAPKSPNWRLVPLSDIACKTLYHLAIAITSVVAIQKVVEAVNEVIAVALPTAVATRGLAALAVAGVLLRSIVHARRAVRASTDLVRTPQMNHWLAILRLLAWSILVVLVGAVLIGYVAFASFLVEQIIAVAGTLALLYILLAIADEGFAHLFRPKGTLGRMLMVSAGLRSDALDQMAILCSGAAKVVLYAATVLLVLAPWQFESGDMLGTLNAAFFGFAIGDITISVSAIVVSILLFALVIAATRALQRWLEVKYLPHTRLDSGLQNSIKTSLGYVGSVLAVLLALAHLGVGLDKLAIVAGGLSVGIGLGLQAVTNNFVSGLIILWERAVRVGDRITVGGEEGYVRRINVRSTEIETFDRAVVVMPNASLVTGTVKNWVRNDRVGRIALPFALPLSSDPEAIRATLSRIAKNHDLVLGIPAPQVLFTAMSDTQISLLLICFVEDGESAGRVTSDLLFEIHARFKEAGLIAPPAPPVVTSPALDKLDAWLSARATPGGHGARPAAE